MESPPTDEPANRTEHLLNLLFQTERINFASQNLRQSRSLNSNINSVKILFLGSISAKLPGIPLTGFNLFVTLAG